MTSYSGTLKWPNLNPGDTIEIVAPGSAIPEDTFESTLKFLKDAGFVPRFPQDIFAPELFCSNTDENRAKHFIAAIHDPKSKAIWCIRNGYGSNRIMPYLTKINKPKRAKLFLGSSDATPIHTFLNQNWRWPTLWAPALDKVATPMTPQSLRSELGQILMGKSKEVVVSGLQPLNPNARFTANIDGLLIGGRLSSICATIGTMWQPVPDDFILFLEESSCPASRIDQMLEQLYQVGLLSQAKALVFGSFYRCTESDGNALWPAVLERIARKVEIPMLFGIPSSSTDRDRPIPLGTNASLITGIKNKLTISVNGTAVPEGTFNSTYSNIA